MPKINLSRTLPIVAVILLMAVSLPQQAHSSQEASVSFAFWGDPAEADAYEQVIASFESRNSNVQVEAQYTPGKEDYGKRVSTSFAGGAPPDVFLINYRDYGQYADSGALEPLGPRLDASEHISENDFYELPLDAFRFNGEELVCIPQNISSLVVYYNVDLFEAAGVPLPTADWTLDEFVDAATALTMDEDGDGITDVHGLATESSLIRYAPFIWTMGGEIVDDVNNPSRLTLDTPEARAGMEWFMDLGAQGHNVVPSEAEALAEDDLSRFMNGRAAMFMQSRRVVPTLREIDGFKWDVAPLPSGDEPAGILHSDAFCMSADAENKDAAWAFIEYAVGPDGQEVLAETGRTVPSMKSVAESPVFLGDGDEGTANPPSSHVFLDTIPALRRVPSTSTWPEVEDIFNAEFQKALYGEVDLDEAIANVQANTEDAFRRAQGGP
ncbi:MAG TPA: sugar ABC transporter substrate-binding protein [Thermomicrobiales bacterium]|nr:sugar ABC transporter substrate-binding protein [Thermomicrobiales bacterium]